MDKHITAVSRAACLSIRNQGLIHNHINQPVVELLTHTFISCRPDKGNSLLRGLNKSQVHRLQRLQNTADRLVTLSRKFTHITPIVKQLHWLCVQDNPWCVSYLCNLVKPYVPARDNLRSADKLLLVEHKAKTRGEHDLLLSPQQRSGMHWQTISELPQRSTSSKQP